jgi:hypothetical protein
MCIIRLRFCARVDASRVSGKRCGLAVLARKCNFPEASWKNRRSVCEGGKLVFQVGPRRSSGMDKRGAAEERGSPFLSSNFSSASRRRQMQLPTERIIMSSPSPQSGEILSSVSEIQSFILYLRLTLIFASNLDLGLKSVNKVG